MSAVEEEWAGARKLVDSSYQPTYVVLEGHNPIPSGWGSHHVTPSSSHPTCSHHVTPSSSHPLRLVMHFPAGQPAGHLNLQGKRANHVNSRPLTSPLGYNSVWNRVRWVFPVGWPVFSPDFRRSDPGSDLGSSG